MNLLNDTIAAIGKLDYDVMARVQQRLDNLTKPRGSLGRLEDLARQIAGITGKERPELKQKVIFILAADHGVADEGVSAYPKEVTAQMVHNFLSGGAGINALARQINARVVIVDMGVAGLISGSGFRNFKIKSGTDNFTKGPAMTREQAIESIESGIRLVEEESGSGLDIIGTGDMGIGNTTSSSAITALFTGRPAEEVTGYGAGINQAAWPKKAACVRKGLDVNKPDLLDPIDVLSKVGGFEIGGIAGLILGAARSRIPVVIDGFISGAGALIAVRLAPQARDFIIAGHCSNEPGHKYVLDCMSLEPLLDLNLRLGEGTGAALAMSLCESALRILNEMSTFGEAGVSDKIKEK